VLDALQISQEHSAETNNIFSYILFPRLKTLQASLGSTDEMNMEEDGTDRDLHGPFIREDYNQRPTDFEE
jgi:hypothetical protein